jgi:hypothetical protein
MRWTTDPVQPCWMGRSSRGRSSASPEVVAAALAVALALVGLVAGSAALVLIAMVAAGALVFSRWLHVDMAILAAVCAVFLIVALVGLVAAAVGVDLLATGPMVGAVLVLVVTATAGAATLRRRPVSPVLPAPGRRPLRLLVYAPAAVLVLVGLLDAASGWRASGWALGPTDMGQHLVWVKDLQLVGGLPFIGPADYPKGLHWLLAVAASPSRPDGLPQLAEHDLRVVASAAWLAVAVASLACAALAVRLAEFLRLPEWALVLTGVIAGGYFVVGEGPFVWLVQRGAPPTALLVGLLWLPVLVAIDRAGRPGMRRAVVAASLAAAAAAFLLWQAVALVPVLALFPMFLLARGERVPQGQSLGWVRASRFVMFALVCLFGGITARVALDGVLAGIVSIPGLTDSLPVASLAVGAAGLALVWSSGWRLPWVRVAFGTAVALATTAIAIAYWAGSKEFIWWMYYPQKALRFADDFLIPFVAAALVGAVVWSLTWLGTRWRGRGRLVAAGAVAGAALLAAALALPPSTDPLVTMAGAEGMTGQISRDRWLRASAYATAFEPAVTVPLQTAYNDRVLSILFSFYDGNPTVVGQDSGDRCDWIKSLGRPVHVITSVDRQDLGRQLAVAGCPALPITSIGGQAY